MKSWFWSLTELVKKIYGKKKKISPSMNHGALFTGNFFLDKLHSPPQNLGLNTHSFSHLLILAETSPTICIIVTLPTLTPNDPLVWLTFDHIYGSLNFLITSLQNYWTTLPFIFSYLEKMVSPASKFEDEFQ